MADFISARAESRIRDNYLNRFADKSFFNKGRMMKISSCPLIWKSKSVKVILFYWSKCE